jgi:hypothetical protein
MQDIWCGMPVVGTNATPMTLSRTSRRARWLIPSVFPLKYPFNRPPFPTMIPRLRRLQTICFAAAAAATSGFPQVLAAAAGSFDPLRPEASGYRLEFNGTFDDASGICLKGSQGRPAAGFLWYARLFPVWGTWSQPEISVSDRVLTISGGQIATAKPAPNHRGYEGRVFSGGGYFEARISFDPATVAYDIKQAINNRTNWWPCFYAFSLEYLAGADQWEGQLAGFAHFAEDDFFECWQDQARRANWYGATVHDWYGMRDRNAGGLGYSDIANDGRSPGVPDTQRIRLPANNDWREFHTVGSLWVAAAGDSRGFIQTYFDGQPVSGKVTWRAAKDALPPPSGSAVFSVIDRDHMVVYVGSPSNTPLHIQWVRVWQIPTGNGTR